MKKILMSLFTIAIVGALIGGGVMAVFSDTETSGQNVFTAATLDLEVGGGNPVSFTFDNMKPGDRVYMPFNLKNVGTLNGTLGIRILNRVNFENGLEEPETAAGDTGEPGELGEQCILRIWHDTNNNGVCDPLEYRWPQWGSGMILNDIPLDYNLFASYTMLAGSEHLIIFRLVFQNLGSTNNVAMGDSVQFDIEFRLTQQ